MKKFYRIMALLLVVLTLTSTLCSCGLVEGIMGIFNPDGPGEGPDITLPHQCESKCPKCGKCLDKSCTEAVCKDKCAGHNGTPAHTCESKCPDCGKCLDNGCTFDVCIDKCTGHHECESKCPDCGKCLDSQCKEDACAVKCEGHETGVKNPEAYGYLPIIREEMAAIYINTPNGDNSWATKYDRNDKINGLIDYVDATVSVDNCEAEYEMADVAAEVKVRGNYTLDYAKKPIRIKFNKKANLLGLHEGEKYKNWVLLADWKDLSMTNNTVAFYLGNTILGSDGYYCTDFRNVEVYLDGQYWGVYLLVEQQEAKDGRTSVPEVPEEDDVGYTGNDIGYFFEFDGYWNLEGKSYLEGGEGDPTFTMNHQGLRSGNNGYTVKSDLYATSQLDFLKAYMNNAFYIAYQANYNDTYYKFNEDYTEVVLAPDITTAKQAVGNVIDLRALVDMYILNEIAKDLDFDWSSIYLSLNMTAEGNKKITFEAPWDFDSCFGMINRENCSATNDMYAANDENPWIQLVKNEDWFWDMVHEKWAEIKKYGVLENTIKLVKTEKETYKDYYIKNFTKWSQRVSQGNSECVSILNTYKDVNTAQGLAADYLIDWLTKRFAYLDSQWYTYEAEIPEAYGYMPIIREEMAAIHINTTDGSNEWATKYNKNDKTAGNIDYVDATVSVDSCEEGYEMTDVAAEVKVRGNATLNYVKKPIRIKFTKKNNLLGLNDGEKFKNWVLLADWKDLSMMNNSLAFYLGNVILGSDGYYCTDFRNVEVYLNGQYWGVYLLVEQQEVKDGRTSVPEVPEEDDVGYTGNDVGYFFEYDGYYTEEGTSYLDGGEGDPTFTMSYPSGASYRSGIGYTVKSDLYAKSQLEFLRTYLNNAFYIAYEATKGNYYKFDEDYNVVADSSGSNAKSTIASVIDIQSLVDVYILNEIACDLDVDWSSFYLSLNMTADGNKKVTFEAPWDWDSCFGLRSNINNQVPNAQGMYASTKNNPWFRLVTGQDWFWDMVKAKWADMKKHGVIENTLEFLNAEKETYKDYYIHNYERWSSRVTQGNGECNATLNSFRDVNTAQGLAADWLIDWLTKRFAYLDSQWGDGEFGKIEVDENLPEDAEVYKYEAENSVLGNFSSSNPIRTNKSYASNNSYVGNVGNGTTLTFTVTAEADTVAYLFAGVSKRSSERSFTSMFKVTVNGEDILIPSRSVPAISGSEEDWHTFISVKLAPIVLKEGTNTIVITTISGDATNFDYIEIYSAEELS